MSLFQCEHCGARENTACSGYHYKRYKREPAICSECETGEWHGKFNKLVLPIGIFVTNAQGNLEHKETGETDLSKYEIKTLQPAHKTS